MNREQEHYALRQEQIASPPELEDVLAQAQARAKKRKAIRNCFAMSLGTVAAVFLLFVGLVNLSPAVSAMMERIPGLQQLTIAVSFSPSLTEAVEQDFVQAVGLEQTIDDVTMRVEHLVVDNQQLHIFFTLDSPTYFRMDANTVARDVEADEWGGNWATLYMRPRYMVENYENGVIRHLIVGFPERVPDAVIWEGALINLASIVCEEAYWCCQVIGEFSFILELDDEFVGQGDLITLDYDFVLDGQRLTLTTVELNPIHTSANFTADEENTAWLRVLDFYLENERGERFDSSAILGNIRTDWESMMMDTHFLESVFFSESESLTMVIEEVTWLDKAMERVRIDLVNGTADPLPEGIRFVGAEQTDTGWILTFSVLEDGAYQNAQIIYERVSEYAWTVSDNVPGLFFYRGWPHAQYDDTVLYVTPQYSRVVRLETPLEIRIK